jgi:hypothetical protein
MKKDMSAFERLKSIVFKTLPEIKRHSLKQINSPEYRRFVLTYLPEKSKSLSINLVKDIWAIEDSKLFTIKMHLYMEAVISEILSENLKKPELLENYSFYRKVEILNAMGILNDSSLNDLLHLNNIRNKFAHNLTYDLSDVNMSKFSDLRGVYSIINYKRKAEKCLLNLYLLRIEMMFLVMKFGEKFTYISLLDIE